MLGFNFINGIIPFRSAFRRTHLIYRTFVLASGLMVCGSIILRKFTLMGNISICKCLFHSCYLPFWCTREHIDVHLVDWWSTVLPRNIKCSQIVCSCNLLAGFTMYTTCVIWLAFVPLYFGTANHVPLRITSMSVTISLSASVTVACLFSPKVSTLREQWVGIRERWLCGVVVRITMQIGRHKLFPEQANALVSFDHCL